MGIAKPQVDRENWSGDGDLTIALVETLTSIEQVGFVRVEDAPASESGAAFSFICNEIYVGFRIQRAIGRRRVLGLPLPAIIHRKSLSLERLGDALAAVEGIGAPDYADGTMLQYLRSERSAAAYQARGAKLVEMVRVYEVEPQLSATAGDLAPGPPTGAPGTGD